MKHRTLILAAAFFAAGFAMLATFSTALAASTPGKQEVIVYNWSEYIPQSVLDDFTKETGIKVIYSTFETNEAMYTKVKLLRGKSYDVVFPSGYFVEKMANDKLITQIDHSKLPNLANLDKNMLGLLPFDPQNNYSIPYMWGLTGIGYNKKYIKEPVTKWTDLLRPEFKGRVILSDDLRDAFGVALRAKGLPINAIKSEEIASGYEFLRQLKPSVRVFDVTAIKQALISEEVWIGPIWNGDYLVAQEENADLAFVYPEEGAIGWVDNFVILKEAPNLDNAYTFINYMLRPDVALRCVEEFKYSTPNKAALEIMPAEMRANDILVPNEKQMQALQFPADLGSVLQEYEKYWGQLKANK